MHSPDPAKSACVLIVFCVFSVRMVMNSQICAFSQSPRVGPVFFMCFSSVQFSHVRLFATPWIAAHQASLSITNYRSLLKLMPIESVMPYRHLILCHPLLLPPSISPSIRVFSSESILPIRWPKCWSSSFSISPSNEDSGPISFRMDCLDLLAVQKSSPTPQFKSISSSALSFL